MTPSLPSAVQGTSAMEQAQGLVVKTSLKRSANRRSKPALWATTSAAGAANAATASGSMVWPATMASSIPVRAVISGEMAREGWRSRLKGSPTPTIAPSGR